MSLDDIREKTIKFLWEVVELSADEVFKKKPEEIKKRQRQLVGWAEGKNGEPQAVPIDKLKAADLLLKYLTAENKANCGGGGGVVIIRGEELISE